jgi:hypothetical protein
MTAYAVVIRGAAVQPGTPLPGAVAPHPGAEAPEPEKALCAGTKADGGPCGAYPKADSAFCVAHQDQDPAAAEDPG